jgi:peptidylprolyl isomerase
MAENSWTVEKGDYLLIDYVAKFEDGTVFDTTSKEKSLKAGTCDTEKEYRPLFCRVDMSQFMKGIDKGVLGIACPRTCKANLNYR